MPLESAHTNTKAPFRIRVYIGCAILAAGVNWLLGKEVSWDLLHYHFYLGFSALHDRFGQDYFAAGPQSYFNPYAYVPFYLLVRSGLPALMVGTALATLHSAVLWVTYELAGSVCPMEGSRQRLVFGLCVVALALMNPILLQQIGTSFSDVTTTVLVLGGWLCLVKALQRPRTGMIIAGAILLGVASALKPTNLVHSLAALLLLVFLPGSIQARLGQILVFGIALGSTFVLVVAPWSYRLAGAFGNPMFPLMNGIFKSPDLTTESLRTYRFVPDSFTEALLRPFAMARAEPMVQEELLAPDIRYAVLLGLLLVFISAWAWCHYRGARLPIAERAGSATRVLMALCCGFVADWTVWLYGSGNGRYFIPMSCIAAVLIVALLFQLLRNHPRGRNGILFALFLAQGAHLLLETDFRWNPAPWGGPWFGVQIPEKLTREPNLYLSIGGPSNSFLAPFLPAGSAFSNISGEFDLGPAGTTALRVRRLIGRFQTHVRVLVSGQRIFENAMHLEPRQSDIDDLLGAFGLRVDMSDCATIIVQGLRLDGWRAPNSSIPPQLRPGRLRYTSHLASCHVVADTRDRSLEAAQRRNVDLILNRLEDACPALFQPSRPQTEHVNRIWLRRYGSTDLTAWVGDGEVKFIDAIRNPQEISLGSVEAWKRRSQELQCGRSDEIYFARLVRSDQ